MEKQWFVRVNDRSEGPLTLNELLTHPDVTVDTYVWRGGMEKWKRIKDIPELVHHFSHPNVEKVAFDAEDEDQGGERILSLSPDPGYLVLLLIFLVIILLYFAYELFT